MERWAGWEVAGASRGKLEDVYEDALVGVASVVGQHAVVHELLSALGLWVENGIQSSIIHSESH